MSTEVLISGRPRSEYRTDIQALRGIAVLAVLFYHSGLGLAQSGYLGVDVFFVISGYLITGIVTRRIDAGTFSFRQFYERRVKRLMPAGLLTLAATLVGAMLFLTSRQYGDYYPNLLGSLTFTANITLWMQSGYFHPASEFQPLLHMWSLAIEEQYYLLMPVALVMISRRWWRWAIALVTLLSLALAIWLWPTKPGAAFFLLPTRAWELGLGSFAAVVAIHPRLQKFCLRLFWPAMAMLLAAIFLVFPGPRPGLGAVAACTATAIIILAQHDGWRNWGIVSPIAAVGDFSYSLYLVHWPIFAFTRLLRMDAALPVWLSIALMLASLLTAMAMYRFVERPFRTSNTRGWRLFVFWIAASVAIALAATAYRRSLLTSPAIEQLSMPVKGLNGLRCFNEGIATFSDSCRQPGRVRMMLWGDSFSSHLVPGLIATTPVPFMQAPRPHCSTFVDYGAYGGPNERRLAENCILYFQHAVTYLRQHSDIDVVAIAGRFDRSAQSKDASAVRYDGKSFTTAALGVQPTIEAMARTVAMLRSAGKRVVVITAAPPANGDLGECWLRQVEAKPSFGETANCSLTLNSGAKAREFEALIAGFQTRAHVPVIRLDEFLCDNGGRCRLEANGMPIFRDDGHFTPWGSTWVGKRADLGKRIMQDAR